MSRLAKKINISQADADLRISCWEEGMNAQDAADLCGITVQALRNWLRLHGYDVRRLQRINGIDRDVLDDLIKLREAGWGFHRIAAISGFDYDTVRRYLHNAGY